MALKPASVVAARPLIYCVNSNITKFGGRADIFPATPTLRYTRSAAPLRAPVHFLGEIFQS